MAPVREVVLPDIGDFKDVEVIEVLVKPGDDVEAETPLITLESDKATMEVPSPYAGTVQSIQVEVGDRISEGATILALAERSAGQASAAPVPEKTAGGAQQAPVSDSAAREAITSPAVAPTPTVPAAPAEERPPPALPSTEVVRGSRAHASPSVRRFARELGVDLGLVTGSGPKGRILKDDVTAFTRKALSGPVISAPAGEGSVSAVPPIDFSCFGQTELRPLSKVKRIAGEHLHRSWSTIPHVTQFDEADITELEAFRQAKRKEAAQKDIKLTLLAFLLKAAVVALKRHPQVNSSLTSDGEGLVFKKYFHIGIAVNTDLGLFVPVIRDVDQKGLYQLAAEVQALSNRARTGKIEPRELQGGCFTVSSLGGVGGTGFTPIINPPEVAILGVSRAAMRPVHDGQGFAPRLLLPLCLSYDHRVIDGVAAAGFTRLLAEVLSDIRHILL
ncbi:MAG: 2-oxo acid dehydrogenase subunit E2 [Pseudomonadota bacterium]|nr:2-oxo acid dehydrogenase subunit E2 [Pseudomonadota bacterium]